MTNAYLAPAPRFVALDNDGQPLVGGQLFTYAAGTNTPIVTYLDPAAASPNTNPVILDSRGSATVFLLPNVAYKLVLEDAASNPIWTQDNIVNSVLLTLYGGVDTGTVNAYVLNFTADFSAYQDGIVIYWIPANTNTGASTVNVNGLGVIPILNQAGVPLTGGLIVAGQVATMIYYNGNFLLTNPSLTLNSGSFTGTMNGFTAPVSVFVAYYIVGNMVTLRIAQQHGTSNAATFTLTFNQAVLTPLIVAGQWFSCPAMQDNTLEITNQIGYVTGNTITHQTTLTFFKNDNPSGWTASGAKGIGGLNGAQPVTIINYFIS